MNSSDDRGRFGPLSRLWHAFDGLAGDTMWSAALDLLAVLAAMVSFVLLTRVLDPPEYGSFTGLYALSTTFSAITYSGPGLALVQRRFRYNEPLDQIQGSFLSLAVIAGALATVLSILLSFVLIELPLTEIVLITASELFAASMIWVASWLVQIAADFPAMIRVRMMAVGLKLVAVPALFVTDNLTVRNLGLTYLVLYGALAAWLIFHRLPRLGYHLSFRRPPEDAWRSSAVFAVPLAASQIQLDGDKVALNAFGLRYDAGIYAAAYRVVLLGSLPIRVIGQAAFHRFLHDGEDEADGYHLRRAAVLSAVLFVIGWLAAGAIYVVLYLLTPIIDFLINDEFAEAKDIVPWLALFIPLMAISGTPLNALLGLGKTRERAAIYLSSAAVSALLYVTLIPWLGWQGAVAATLISETYLVVVSWAAMIHYQRRADRRRGRTPSAGVPG
ncbi:MAG: lipopolysaccharide biosynthesis protein [Actinomycetota bacterium]